MTGNSPFDFFQGPCSSLCFPRTNVAAEQLPGPSNSKGICLKGMWRAQRALVLGGLKGSPCGKPHVQGPRKKENKKRKRKKNNSTPDGSLRRFAVASVTCCPISLCLGRGWAVGALRHSQIWNSLGPVRKSKEGEEQVQSPNIASNPFSRSDSLLTFTPRFVDNPGNCRV